MAPARDSGGRFIKGKVEVLGTVRVTAKLKRTADAIANRVAGGLIKAGFLLQGLSQELVPVEFGVLRNSARTRWEGTGLDRVVFVTYGTSYAIFVHEITTNWHAPGTQAKFLEQPARTHKDQLVAVVIDAARGVTN